MASQRKRASTKKSKSKSKSKPPKSGAKHKGVTKAAKRTKPKRAPGKTTQRSKAGGASAKPTVAEIFETMEYGPAPESDALALEWLASHDRRLGHYIDGAWREPHSGSYFEVRDPGRDEKLAEVAEGDAKDVDAAVAAAKKAQPMWEAMGGQGRARYLYAIARHIQKHHRLLAVLESRDNGKPIRESRDIDVPLVARHFYHHAGWAALTDTELSDQVPLGVVGQIIPWNFPLLMLAWKIAPALAMGNTLVLKPAEYTPLSALRFAEICMEVGLPPGVVNIVGGDGKTGAQIVEHPDVAKVAFTGSTNVGRIIRRATAGTGKKLSMELGGKSPFVVFDDADLDSVVEGVVDAIWFNQGQVCCAGSRILAQESIADRLLEKLRARMETLRVGDPLDKAIDMGAIVAPVQLEQIEKLVQQGQDEGATLWQPSWSCPEEGLFYPPTVLSDVAPASTAAQVEIFGPVVVFMSFRTHAEAISLANNTRYGLAASVWTENLNLAFEVAPKIKAGTVWVNCTNMFDAAAGFGGYRESGYGREGGKEGLYEYCKPRWHREPTPKRKKPKPPKAKGGDLIDRTPKLYIGGKHRRPDAGYSLRVDDARGEPLGEVGRGNRKDVRDAVEAAHAARGWSANTAHLRAQVLFYLAENLAARRKEIAARVDRMSGDGEG